MARLSLAYSALIDKKLDLKLLVVLLLHSVVTRYSFELIVVCTYCNVEYMINNVKMNYPKHVLEDPSLMWIC